MIETKWKDFCNNDNLQMQNMKTDANWLHGYGKHIPPIIIFLYQPNWATKVILIIELLPFG